MRTLSITVTPELAGRQVKSLLRRMMIPDGMISRIKLRETGICLNGKRCRTTDRVQAGDILTAEVGDEPVETGITPMAADLPVVWEDEDILIVNKPAGMATHGKVAKGDITAANALAAYWGTSQAFHPVTRLDKGTSGLMVMAKSGYAHERLRSILHTDLFCREYLALVTGELPGASGSITLPMRRDETAKNRFCVSAEGKPARTDYTLLERRNGLSLVRVRLFTGRTHQIRVHFSAVGCPLLGDRVYGQISEQLDRPALHSAFLHLVQPVTGDLIDLSVPMPEDMEAAWNAAK